jgi:hypothetical protein
VVIKSIDEFIDQIIELGLFTERYPILGCNPEQVEQIKTAQGVKYLPGLYEDFLLRMGQEAGRTFAGSDYAYNDLLGLKTKAQHILQQDKIDFELPKDSFVFFSHGGYMFTYFDTHEEQTNPPVYCYFPGCSKPRKEWEMLGDWFEAHLAYLRYIKEADMKRRQKKWN